MTHEDILEEILEDVRIEKDDKNELDRLQDEIADQELEDRSMTPIFRGLAGLKGSMI